MKNISMTSKQIKIMEEPLLEPVSRKGGPDMGQQHKPEYRESDYESDFDGRRSASAWKPIIESDSEPSYRPVRFTPTGRRAQSEKVIHHIPVEVEVRPKFVPIEKPFTSPPYKAHPAASANTYAPQMHKPMPMSVAQDQSHSQTYFKGIAGQPVHNAIETTNSMHVQEHSETNHRVINMNKTTRIINFENKMYGAPEPFPYSPDTGSYSYPSGRGAVPQPPTPTKFVKGEFRESDYESDIESARIRPLWTPNPSDSDEPQYRRVNPPRVARSASCPRTYAKEPVMSPMQFDVEPPLMPAQPAAGHTQDQYRSHEYYSHTLDRHAPKKHYIVDGRRPTALDRADTNAMEMKNHFNAKTQRFLTDLATHDTRQERAVKPILKKEAPQVFRDESRISQYGKSAVIQPSIPS